MLVIGSGFGGSVTALRLTEKGYRVGVLEAGRRFADDDVRRRRRWDLQRFLWAPKLGCIGIQRIHRCPTWSILAGAGVGGGSLELREHALRAAVRGLLRRPAVGGASPTGGPSCAPTTTRPSGCSASSQPDDDASPTRSMRRSPSEMGVGRHVPADPGRRVLRADGREPGVEVDDPFFGGAGPGARGCLECGECMTGCRHGAKNTLVKNYLYLAERAGARGAPRDHRRPGRAAPRRRLRGRHRAHRRLADAGARRTLHRRPGRLRRRDLGTQQLLHRLQRRRRRCRALSDRLGVLTRTNSEALAGASVKLRHRGERDFTAGVAITSSFHPDEHTHIEPVRYGKGSNAMGLLSTAADRRRRVDPAPGQLARPGRCATRCG